MVLGVGVDLISIERIERAYRRRPERFLQRVYTAGECAAAFRRRRPFPALAARFAAKEAVLKAVGCGVGPAGLAEVEIISAPGRPPRVELHGHAAAQARLRGIGSIEVSFTHDPPFAGAMAVALGRKK